VKIYGDEDFAHVSICRKKSTKFTTEMNGYLSPALRNANVTAL
jgi:hypothetical protein